MQPTANLGGLINCGDALCPDQLVEVWEFYRWGDGEINDWEEDPYLTVTCGQNNQDTTKTTRQQN